MEIGYSGNQPVETTGSLCDGRRIQPTIEERLLRRKHDLESNLKDVNEALEALQANPEVLKIMCLISKVNY